MDENFIKEYESKIEELENKLALLEKISEDNELLKKQLNEQNELIDSHYQILNIVMSNKSLKAHGLLRSIQIHAFEMLKFIVKVCSKYDFKYWLDFGTLVGAVRHEGFVPWDDEIDMAMPREDFEKLMQVLPQEVSRFEGMSEKLEIRNGNTVFKNAVINEGEFHPVIQFISRNPLVSVEIYPYDYIDLKEGSEKAFREYRSKYVKVRADFRKKYSEGLCSFNEGLLTANEEAGITTQKTDYIGCSIDGVARMPVVYSDIYPLQKLNFEGQEFYCPVNAKKYLEVYYGGDIMKIPRKVHHHNRVEDDHEIEKYEKGIQFWKDVNEKF